MDFTKMSCNAVLRKLVKIMETAKTVFLNIRQPIAFPIAFFQIMTETKA
ncbi:MAG: hypothetical protein LKG21_05065 [Ruminococcus sp.]|nr:hypothetical protein [Ruminococcus sp.]